MACLDDLPIFPFPKPRELERLERLTPDVIHALTRFESEEHIRDAATSLVKTYMRHTPSQLANFDECLLLVSSALTETGGSIPGQLGALMVGRSLQAAEEASFDYFPDESFAT